LLQSRNGLSERFSACFAVGNLKSREFHPPQERAYADSGGTRDVFAPWFGKAGENSTVWESPSPKFIMGGSDEEKQWPRFGHHLDARIGLLTVLQRVSL
jgi:hypothetical protein